MRSPTRSRSRSAISMPMSCRSTRPTCLAIPEEWAWAASAINRMLDAVPGTPAVHLCFGNYGGQSIQKGSWDQLMQYLNALHADHVVLECAHRPPEELVAFRDLRPEIGFGLGVVDIKATDVESADQVARAIEHAETGARRGTGPLYPSRLRLLDAQALDRGRQDARARRRAAICSRA